MPCTTTSTPLFLKPGEVAAARDDDPAYYRHAATLRHGGILCRSSDADRRSQQVIEPPAPASERPASCNPDFAAFQVNFYGVKWAVYPTEFGDNDTYCLALNRSAFAHPGREIVVLNTIAIAAGGGIHRCAQLEPT